MILTSRKYTIVKNSANQLKIKELATKFKVSTATICKIKKSTDFKDYQGINRRYALNTQKRQKVSTNSWYRPILNFFQI